MVQLHLPALEPHSQAFPEGAFESMSDLFDDLGAGNDSVAVMVTSSEPAFEPDDLSDAWPGELVVIQMAGGMK